MKREEMYYQSSETTREEMYKANVALPPAEGAEQYIRDKWGESWLKNTWEAEDVIEALTEFAAQQKSEIKKPDVDLTFWETWLTTHGYSIEFDADGLWAESWIQEHKWVDIFDLMLQFAIEQNIKMPTAEGAEEILASIVESLGEPINIHNHVFEIRPYTVEHKTEWWIFHKEVSSGEPLAQWLNEFATLHAQKIADKMVEERLREELMTYDQWLLANDMGQAFDDTMKCVDEYLKSREK